MGKGLPFQNQGETRGRQRNGENPKSRYHTRSKHRDRILITSHQVFPDQEFLNTQVQCSLLMEASKLMQHGKGQIDCDFNGRKSLATFLSLEQIDQQ